MSTTKTRDCWTCKFAKNQGKTVACRFDFEKALSKMPTILAQTKVTMTATLWKRIPQVDCPAWKKGGKGPAGGSAASPAPGGGA